MVDIAQLQPYKDQLLRIQSYDSKLIIREPELGSQLAFYEEAKQVEDILQLFKKFDADSILDLPPSYLSQLKSYMDQFEQLYGSFRDFNPLNNHRGSRQQIVASFQGFSNSLKDALAPIISYHRAVTLTIDDRLSAEKAQLAERARLAEDQYNIERERLAEKEQQLNTALERLSSVEEEFKNITINMQEQAAESGITQEALHFDEAAKEYGKSAENWKAVVFLLSALVIATVIAGFYLMEPPEELEKMIHFVASKVMIFGTLFYILGMSAKSYAYSMHNRVVNQHRKNALLSYRALVGGATQPALKDRVLEHAAVCIYSHQETGYLKGSTSKSNPIVEIMPKIEGKLTDAS